jgi:hypothetical protein
MEDTSSVGGKKSAWMVHVKKTMRANKGMKLGKVLKLAAKSYKKTKRGGGGSVGETASPLSGGGVAATASPLSGGRRRRGTRKTRKH